MKIPARLLRLGAAVLVLLGITAACDDLPLENGDDTGPRDRTVTVNGVELHYREWGAADAPPVIILHGLTGHSWEFDSVAAALSQSYRVLALDQRGHGASAWASPYSPTTMAADLAGLIDALDLDAVRVVGHSLGGVNSWWHAAKYPEQVEKLVIIDIAPASVTADWLIEFWLDALDAYAAAEFEDPADAVADYLSGYDGPHEAELEAFVLNNIVENDDGKWRWRFDAKGLKIWWNAIISSEPDQWTQLEQITVPTLLVRGGISPFPIEAMEEMEQRMQDATLIEIPGAAHDIHIEQRDALVNALLDFLE